MLSGSLIAMMVIVLVVAAAVAWLVDRDWCREHPKARGRLLRSLKGRGRIRHG
ncbi:hypothetical protein PTE30175_00731 [Pandoraea terrae]|uniref:Uncharacterized protein n=1 Tax=Pandoraea terrae TaxID=1537710 RepID=A0A5E4SHJ7_9BURK|nr:hypothetical protein [Pandoraea terrae]VVD74242.1 hypothetical protein PTE30175_00731 [Pandoraea terrae]